MVDIVDYWVVIIYCIYLVSKGEKQMNNNNEPYKDKQIQVLIITDRLVDQAKVLAEYLQGTNNFEVVGLTENKQQALSIAEYNFFDYLIIAGYLKDETTYDVIAELQKRGKNFLVVQWSMIDSLITNLCLRYKIPLKFERTFPVEDIVRFLEVHKDDPIPSYQKDAQDNDQSLSIGSSVNKSILKKFLRLK